MSKWNPFDSDDDRPDEGHTDGGVTEDRTDADAAVPSSRAESATDSPADDREQTELEARCERLTAELERERADRRALETAVDHLTEVARANADGDLTATPGQPPAEAAEPLYDAYGELLREWTDTVDRMASFSEQVTAATAQVDAFELATGTAADADGTVVEFWHAMGGEKALLLEELVREFESQTDGISLELRSKRSYRGTLDATLAAAERGDPPAIAQIFEIGTTRARDSGHFTPVEELLPAAHIDSLLDPVTNYYRFDGRLYALPLNASNPVMAYNRDAFRAAGLDPGSPPETFAAVQQAAERLVDRDAVETGITFANYSWFVEQWCAEADQFLVDRDNGRSGPPTESYLDGAFARDLFEWWQGLDADGLYHDPGIEARGAARTHFSEGDSAMLIGSTPSPSSSPGSPNRPSSAGGTRRPAISRSTRRRFHGSGPTTGSSTTPTTGPRSTNLWRHGTPRQHGARR